MNAKTLVYLLLLHIGVYAVFVQLVVTHVTKERPTQKRIARSRALLVAMAIPGWQQVIVVAALIGFALGAIRYGLPAVWRGLKGLFRN